MREISSIEEFQLINIKGIILIELECHHFVTPLETKDLSHDHQWLLESRERLLKNLIMDNWINNFKQWDTVHLLVWCKRKYTASPVKSSCHCHPTPFPPIIKNNKKKGLNVIKFLIQLEISKKYGRRRGLETKEYVNTFYLEAHVKCSNFKSFNKVMRL